MLISELFTLVTNWLESSTPVSDKDKVKWQNDNILKPLVSAQYADTEGLQFMVHEPTQHW